jgi:hypothetical protein
MTNNKHLLALKFKRSWKERQKQTSFASHLLFCCIRNVKLENVHNRPMATDLNIPNVDPLHSNSP